MPFNRTLAANIARGMKATINAIDYIHSTRMVPAVSMALKKLDTGVPCIGYENQKVSRNTLGMKPLRLDAAHKMQGSKT